jgi:hypothetical protein
VVRRRDDTDLTSEDALAEKIAEYARRVADEAPPLTEEQRAVLRELLRPSKRQNAT